MSTTVNSKNLGAKRLRDDLSSQKEYRLRNKLKQKVRLRDKHLLVLDFLADQLTDLHKTNSEADKHQLLSDLISRLCRDFEFSECGVMWVNEQHMLELYEVVPSVAEERISTELDKLAKSGAIVRVLQNNKPALKEASVSDDWLVYHAIRTDDHVLGLFVGVMDEQNKIDSVLLRLLAVLLQNVALKLEEISLNNDLIGITQGNNIIHRIKDERIEEDASRIKFISDRDRLTGLANRENFIHHLDILMSQKKSCRLAVMSFDFHEFSRVNEIYGYAVGDQILSEATHRLEVKLQDEAFLQGVGCGKKEEKHIARIGEDEFGLIIEVGADYNQDEISLFVSTIIDELGRNYSVTDGNVRVVAHAGISFYPGDAKQAGDLLARAQLARTTIRHSNTEVSLFKDEMLDTQRVSNTCEQELTEALKYEQFRVWYQPKFDPVSQEIKGAEALLRWQHPGKGLLSANQFVKDALSSGVMHDIGLVVFKDACRLVSEANQSGYDHFNVSINVSSSEILHPETLQNFKSILLSEGVSAERFELELNESYQAPDKSLFAKALFDLSSLGFLINIDDFGLEQSSFALFRELPINGFNINQSLVRGFAEENADRAIVSGLASIGRSLDLQVNAKGVESEEQLKCISELECDQVQGFHLGEPSGLSHFDDLLAKWESLPQT